ncbi:alpha/beta fold hydrolase [Leptolyngbya cf. ectocarpi LEGE 11479]|uniref:Alpha/beta fold hydrolase n=1 Tax=Leptolyngbya cf. ectocarpi LEGE 11479 TaxID=1828722 RepID=A0A928ZX60_LEPEC|nr:alpha/beta fold hydrolase [Leptolyngbya ectocarpi]MBE9069137.1 alpha/beta fold hydrolase [Leptolyngbya cf. ectocarpi LEGE 11479]
MTHDGKPAVVLVHGLWNTVNIFGRLYLYLERQGWDVHAVSLMPNNGDIGIDQQAEQLHRFVELSLGSQRPFYLVGFSMGGLVSRYYLQRLGGLRRVRRFVGVAVPHYGSVLAWFRWNVGGIQMRPGSSFLADLNWDMEQLLACRPLSLWTPYDLLVLPARHCCLPIGENQRLPVTSHNGMLRDELSLRAIATALAN